MTSASAVVFLSAVMALVACGSSVTVIEVQNGAGGVRHPSAVGAGGAVVSSAFASTGDVSPIGADVASSSPAATSSSSGSGGCGPNQMTCKGYDYCIDPANDPADCGGCFEICGSGQVCVASKCQSVACFGVIEAHDQSKVTRSEGWNEGFGNVTHDGEDLETWSQVSNASLSWKFVGTGLIVYYARGPNAGDFTVSVDGGPAVLVHNHLEPDFQFQTPALIANGLAYPAPHQALLKCVPGTGYCYVDYFGILGAPPCK